MQELLNRAEAMIVAKIAKLSELAAVLMLDKPPASRFARASEWIIHRTYPISNPDIVMRLQLWVAEQTLTISADEKLGAAYRKAFRAVVRKRGVRPKP